MGLPWFTTKNPSCTPQKHRKTVVQVTTDAGGLNHSFLQDIFMKDWPWFKSPAINLAAIFERQVERFLGLPLLRSLQILDSLAIFPPNEIVLVSIWYHSSPVFLVETWVSLLDSNF